MPKYMTVRKPKCNTKRLTKRPLYETRTLKQVSKKKSGARVIERVPGVFVIVMW